MFAKKGKHICNKLFLIKFFFDLYRSNVLTIDFY